MGRFFRTPTGRIALGSVLAAGSLVILMLGCLLPTGKLGVTALAGLFPMVGVLAGGRTVGLLCWAAASVLGMLLLPDKGISLLYAIFLGLYPVVKERIEGIRKRPVEWIFKLVYFDLALMAALFVFQSLFLPMLPEWSRGVLFVGGNFVFVCYDIGLSRLIGLLRLRLGLY